MFIDSHCHINSDEFAADREEVVKRAREMKVDYILDVSDNIAKTPRIIDFCRNHHHIFTTTGVHPEIADKYSNLSVNDILRHTSSRYVVGIGECGLDYYYNAEIKQSQRFVFERHIEAAQISGLPLIIHSRDADKDMMEILQSSYRTKPFCGELHCFSSSPELCRAALDIGFYISASGIITFKKSDRLREIFAQVPQDRLLAETDAPYLAPVPHRGSRNEPAYVVNTFQTLAEIHGVSLEAMAEICRKNFLRLFKKVEENE